MGYVKRRENIRVEVEPRNPGDCGGFYIGGQENTEAEEVAACEQIAAEIRRHVEGLPSRGAQGVVVVWDTKRYCEHCGSVWGEPDDSPHNGGCCGTDSSAMPDEGGAA